MKHLNTGNAADLVRGIAPARHRRWMEQHLDTDCARCHELVAFVRAVAAVAQSEALWEPPAEVFERAADIFPERRARVAPLRRRLLPRLVFDSFREPLPVGIRSRASVSRQLLYRAGSFSLDLRLDYEQGGRRVSLVGQIAPRVAESERQPKVATPPVSVLLMDGEAILAQAPLTPFGEFHLDYEPQPRLRLRVPLGAVHTGVELPLTRLLRPRAEPGPDRPNRENPGRKS
jgi:hypothetical protein